MSYWDDTVGAFEQHRAWKYAWATELDGSFTYKLQDICDMFWMTVEFPHVYALQQYLPPAYLVGYECCVCGDSIELRTRADYAARSEDVARYWPFSAPIPWRVQHGPVPKTPPPHHRRNVRACEACQSEPPNVAKPEVCNYAGMPYQEYLRTEHWQSVRMRELATAGYRCRVCNAKGGILDVHHRTYERLGAELATDVLALCRDCHTRFHVR